MQTFLPFACVDRSLRCLDHKRLHKQLSEAIQMLRILAQLKRGEQPKGYGSHPAVLMWVGHERYLRFYACRCSEIIRETTRRVKDGQPYDTRGRDASLREELGGWITQEELTEADKPSWFGNDNFHSSHRASLYRKKPGHYILFEADAPLHDDYVWPVRSEKAKSSKAKKSSPNVLGVNAFSCGRITKQSLVKVV